MDTHAFCARRQALECGAVAPLFNSCHPRNPWSKFVFIRIDSWLEICMAEHARYEKLVAEAKKHVTEISPRDAATKLKGGEAVIVDVRDKDEWDEGRIPGAIHMSRGTIELDIEEKVSDPNAMIICHCGGGGRGALAAESLQKMGYTNVRNMSGGFKAWKSAGLPTTK
jgi:rhodanese-related sulfurtransferase